MDGFLRKSRNRKFTMPGIRLFFLKNAEKNRAVFNAA